MGKAGGQFGRQIPWLGMVSLACGGTLLYLYFTRPSLTSQRGMVSLFVYLGMGSILFLWGVWLFFAELLPGLARGRQRRMRVSMPAEAMVYVTILFSIFFAALMGKSNLLMLVFALLSGPFVINGSITLAMLRRISARRRIPDHAVAGEWFSVELQLENRKRIFSSWMLVAQDTIQHPAESLQGTVMFARIPAVAEQSGTYELRLRRRGVYRFGPLELASRYPLGLMERAVVLEDSADLIVYPQIGQLTDKARGVRVHSRDPAAQRRPERGTFDDEFYRLREYRPGDSMRTIHWRTSARWNELMVREYHQDRDHSLLVILDLWQPKQPSGKEIESREAAVSAAATFCVDFCRRGGQSRLILGLNGKQIDLWDGPGTEAALVPIMERLAVVEAGSGTGLAELIEKGLRESSSETRRLLITTRQSHATNGDDGLTAALAGVAAGTFEIVEADPQKLREYVIIEDDDAK